MSERSEDREVLALIDRAAAHTPPLHLDRRDVVARGQQIVRRRRGAGAGMALAAVVTAGTVWLGLAGEPPLLGTSEVVPASVTWEVEELTTLTVLDAELRGGDLAPFTVNKWPDGRASATFTVDGVEETVEGTRMAGGADLFVGDRATVVLWEESSRARTSVSLFPEPEGRTGGQAQEDEDVRFLATTDRGYVPEELIFSDDDLDVWAAGGVVAETAVVSDGRHAETVFSLSDLGVAGVVDDGGITPVVPDWTYGSGGSEPWWRGGAQYEWFVARTAEDVPFVRLVWVDEDGGTVHPGEPVETTVVGDAAFAVFSFTPDEVPVDRTEYAYTFQWSRDGQTWHDRDVDGPGPPVTDDGPVGEGGRVRLLGELYEVAVDDHGWPMLLHADGSTFLTVGDELGPSAGGAAMWREHWWPWSGRNAVHFFVGWEPPDGVEVVVQSEDGWFEPEDVVTIAGPEGVVTLVSVPAEDDGFSVTGLGLRTEDGVRPVSP